jgi:hypothetical protein
MQARRQMPSVHPLSQGPPFSPVLEVALAVQRNQKRKNIFLFYAYSPAKTDTLLTVKQGDQVTGLERSRSWLQEAATNECCITTSQLYMVHTLSCTSIITAGHL